MDEARTRLYGLIRWQLHQVPGEPTTNFEQKQYFTVTVTDKKMEHVCIYFWGKKTFALNAEGTHCGHFCAPRSKVRG